MPPQPIGLNYQTQLLVVEDDAEFLRLMRDELGDLLMPRAATDRPKLRYALGAAQARAWLRTEPLDVLSLDMRVPEAPGLVVTAQAGMAFAKSPLVTSETAKAIVYSAGIGLDELRKDPGRAMLISSAPVDDRFAKADQDRPADDANPHETLAVDSWASRLLEYADSPGPDLPGRRNAAGQPRRSAIGAWLDSAPRLLPPLLARLADQMRQHWGGLAGRLVALRLAEVSTHLAVLQTALLLRHEGQRFTLPASWPWHHQIDWLRHHRNQHSMHLRRWNWAAWLTDDAVEALDRLRLVRDEYAHKRRPVQAVGGWQDLQTPLRHLMRLTSYWASHPLCLNIQHGRDGQRAEVFAGLQDPLLTRPLDGDAPFPAHALQTHDQAWQVIWHSEQPEPADDQTPPLWQPVALPWPRDWLQCEDGRMRSKVWQSTAAAEWLDLSSGQRVRESRGE